MPSSWRCFGTYRVSQSVYASVSRHVMIGDDDETANCRNCNYRIVRNRHCYWLRVAASAFFPRRKDGQRLGRRHSAFSYFRRCCRSASYHQSWHPKMSSFGILGPTGSQRSAVGFSRCPFKRAWLIVPQMIHDNPMARAHRERKLAPLPRWLFWVFLIMIGALALRPSLISVWTVVPLVLANVIYQALEWWARRA